VKFEATPLQDVWLVRLDPHVDARGFFARSFCAEEFAAHGLAAGFEQSSLSRNAHVGTVRGMHYQRAPFEEAKLVRCVQGAVFDVALDLRPSSPTLGKWFGATLSAVGGEALYLGPGLAHGFQTLCDDTDVLYQITPAFQPGHGAGVRWNDPSFGISWPLSDVIISERDGSYADWRP
jgi:dTDP-4-dehydrorhamnose 3,5-epimerase